MDVVGEIRVLENSDDVRFFGKPYNDTKTLIYL